MSLRLTLTVLLLCASCPLAAHEIRMLSAAGDGGAQCQDSALVRDDSGAPPAGTAARSATHAVKPVKAKPGVRHADTPLGDIRPPRWHSFLPGMFR